MEFRIICILSVSLLFLTACQAQSESWVIDSQTEWTQAKDSSTNILITDGFAEPNQSEASFQSVLKTYTTKQKPQNITLTQSDVWDNWTEIPTISPYYTGGAPVFLPIADKDYWFFAKKDKQYHAWQSSDLKNWTYHGLACTSPWVIDAEYVPQSNNTVKSASLVANQKTVVNLTSGTKGNGKFYFYYDKPNDEDPHLDIASYSDLINGIPAKETGMVFNDPSHGSDAAIFRDDDGRWHLIYEDWDPINARTHSWDSPLAGHSESPDGINGFLPHEYPPPIDKRTTPTGETGTYSHQGRTLTYDKHEPEQNAYGDYSLIKVGTQYYLFCDFHPADQKIRVGRWTSSDITKPCTFLGELGYDIHPDPSIGFAEGKFYLVVEEPEDKDFLSPGPWVDSVEVRVGVDTDNDQTIDTWTPWQSVTEKYSKKPGYAKIVDVQPAQLDLTSLPEGYGFKFEFKTTDTTPNESKPIIDKVEMSFL